MSTELSLLTYLRRLVSLTEGFRCRLVLRVMAGMVRIGAMLLFVYLSKQLVDLAVDQSQSMSPEPLVWGLIGCVALQVAMTAVISRLTVALSVGASNRLRARMFDRAMRSLYGRGLHSADVVERMKKDVDAVVELAMVSGPQAIVIGLQLVAAFVFLSMLDLRLAIVMVAIMPVALLLGRLFMRRMRRLSGRIRRLDSSIQCHIQEHLRHRMVDLAYENEGVAVGRLDRLQMRLFRLMRRRNSSAVWANGFVQAGFSAGYLTAFLWGVDGLIDGVVTFGAMTAFLQLVGQVQRPAVDLARMFPGFVYGMASMERVVAVVDAPVEETGYLPAVACGGLTVVCDDVTFRYSDGDRDVVESFSAVFPAGKVTALVGMTGAGKSTLLRLMLGFIAPGAGAVEYVDGAGYRFSASPSSRRLVAFVPQGNTLVSGTVRSNLLIGCAEADEASMRDALTMACADFVMDLPAGLDTSVGEGGARLSEGQAQRIAIARALLRRDARVLLLDEPTSALDEATEARLLTNLSGLTPERTVIMITHRISRLPEGVGVVEI